MKINFIIEEIAHKYLTLEVPEDTDPKSLKDIAWDEHDRIINSGMELDSCTIDSRYFIQCSECGDHIEPDEIHIVGSNAVCGECKPTAEKKAAMAAIDIDLGSMIQLLLSVIDEYNALKDFNEKRCREFSIMTFESMFSRMNIPCKLFKNHTRDVYTGVTILGENLLIANGRKEES